MLDIYLMKGKAGNINMGVKLFDIIISFIALCHLQYCTQLTREILFSKIVAISLLNHADLDSLNNFELS